MREPRSRETRSGNAARHPHVEFHDVSRLAAALVVLGLALPAQGGTARASAPPAPGRLTLAACLTVLGRGDCGALVVPENRAQRTGRTLALNLLVLRGQSGRAREAVFVLAGGPGQAATDLARGLADELPAMRGTRDVVFVDQRGTGRSHPLNCELIDAASPPSAFGTVFRAALVDRCARALAARADFTHYTTTNSAADLEDVRAALGYERVMLFGTSYGTRLAQAYMRAYPDRVRAAVLDGVVPLDDGPLSYAASLHAAVRDVLHACESRPDCAAAYPRVREQFSRLLDRLRAGPVRVRVAGHEVDMSFGDFAYAVRGILYTVPGRQDLPRLIRDAASSGRFDAFADRYWRRALTFDDRFAHGLHFSVLCAEDISPASDREVEIATAGTFMGRYLFDQYRRACDAWPHATMARAARPPTTQAIPTLLLSGEFDPATPPAFGERVAATLVKSAHVVVPGGAHGSLRTCAHPAMLHVLTTGTLVDLPAVCR